MPRPRNISPDELRVSTKFRIQIVKWKEHNPELAKVKGRLDFVKLKAARTTDTLNEENLEVRGLFLDMLRHSAGGRRPGYIVDGSNEPMSLSRLCRIMNVPLVKIIEPLKRLMVTDRIKVQVESSSAPETAPETAEKPLVEPKKPEPDKIGKQQAARVFWLAWNEIHLKSYHRAYDKNNWDEANLLKSLTPDNLERMIAYAFYFHQHEPSVGINKGRAPSLNNFLKLVSEYSSILRGQRWEMSQKFSQKFLQRNLSSKKI